MSQGPRRSELLIRWQEAREHGQELTPEELCRDCPEMLAELRREIALLDHMERLREADDSLPGDIPPLPPMETVPMPEPPAESPQPTVLAPTEPAAPSLAFAAPSMP